MRDEWNILQFEHQMCSGIDSLVARLANNSVAAVQIRNFFPKKHLEAVVKNIEAEGVSWYPNFEHKQGRIGLCATEYFSKPDGKEHYFALAPRHSQIRKNIFSEELDPVRLLTNFFSPHFSISVAQEGAGGASYFVGLIRAMQQESTVHFDYAPHQLPGWQVADAEIQLGTVIYLQMPKEGGGLKIYNHQWDIEDDKFNKDLVEKGPEGFDPKFLRQDNHVVATPSVGDMIIFNTRNFHQVTGINADCSRLTCNSFLSVKEGTLLLWN